VFSPNVPEITASLQNLFPLPCMDPEDYTGIYVALASRTNAATTTGEFINAADGIAIRGHLAVTGRESKKKAR